MIFPDPTATWQEWPSIIDGINDPFVFGKGCSKGKLYLTVHEGGGDIAFGVFMDVIAYMAVDEALFSVVGHSCKSLSDWPNCYIRRAENSKLLSLYASKEYLRQGDVCHFQFLGHDKCFECLCFGLPQIVEFATERESDAWGPS